MVSPVAIEDRYMAPPSLYFQIKNPDHWSGLNLIVNCQLSSCHISPYGSYSILLRNKLVISVGNGRIFEFGTNRRGNRAEKILPYLFLRSKNKYNRPAVA